MKKEDNSRRRFLKGAIGAAGLMITGTPVISSWTTSRATLPTPLYDPRGLPTAILGRTGVRIPRVAIGLGSRFCSINSTEEALELLNFALDNGLYYWDTAWSYENKELGVVSEERIGRILKTRRKEIFLSTKVASRNPDEAMRQIEASLKRLQTDHLDMLKIHDVQSEKDVAGITGKGNLADILVKMKEQGVTRFIGFSGHSEAIAMKSMAETGIFDSMLMAMNQYSGNTEKRQELVIPEAKAHGMGVMLMKVIRPRETVKTIDPGDLVRYALSLQGPDGIVLGMDSMQVVKSNLEILRHFKPMDEAGMLEMAMRLTPFYNHRSLPWMKPGYFDGNWA
jgi:predicted aldo/keto reductase-like oxidoreductase